MKTKQTTFKREWLDYYLALKGNKSYKQLSDYLQIAPYTMIRKKTGQIGWWFDEVRLVKEFLHLSNDELFKIFPL